jgi:uroporphyrinogen decarboxylase
MPLLDMIVEAGVDALNPLEPAAGMNIAEVKKLYGDKIALVGNIDCGELLCFGTPEQVRQTVKWTIEVAGDNGGFILSSSNSIHSSVKPENYLAMVEAGREFGRYPS